MARSISHSATRAWASSSRCRSTSSTRRSTSGTGTVDATIQGDYSLGDQRLADATIFLDNGGVTVLGEAELFADWTYKGFGATGWIDGTLIISLTTSGDATVQCFGEIDGSVAWQGKGIGTTSDSFSVFKTVRVADLGGSVWSLIRSRAEAEALADFGGLDNAWNKAKKQATSFWHRIASVF